MFWAAGAFLCEGVAAGKPKLSLSECTVGLHQWVRQVFPAAEVWYMSPSALMFTLVLLHVACLHAKPRQSTQQSEFAGLASCLALSRIQCRLQHGAQHSSTEQLKGLLT